MVGAGLSAHAALDGPLVGAGEALHNTWPLLERVQEARAEPRPRVTTLLAYAVRGKRVAAVKRRVRA